MEYRIWDNQEQKYYEPIYEGWRGEIDDLSLSPRGQLSRRTIDKSIHESMFPNRYIVEMFTGLLDINGDKIYENDRVSLMHSNGKPTGAIDTIIFKHAAFWFLWIDQAVCNWTNCKNIGSFNKNKDWTGKLLLIK